MPGPFNGIPELPVQGSSSSEIARVAIKLLCLEQDLIAGLLRVESPTFHQYVAGERAVPRTMSGTLCGMLREQSKNLLLAAEVLEASLFNEYRSILAETRSRPNSLQRDS